MTFRLAIITDVHADYHALRDALAQIDRLGCNQIVCAGDLLDWGLFPEETIALLRQRRIITVRGNHDRWAVTAGRDQSGSDLTARTVGFLESLPTHWAWIFHGVRVLMWHARPGSDMQGIYRDTTQAELSEMVNRASADVLIVGHTHEPFRRRLPGGRWVVNPAPCCGIRISARPACLHQERSVSSSCRRGDSRSTELAMASRSSWATPDSAGRSQPESCWRRDEISVNL